MAKHYSRVWKDTHLNFLNLPNWKKSEQYIKYKRKISALDNPDRDYNFYTNDIFDDAIKYSWCDFIFLSKLHKFAYRGFIVTCQHQIVEDISHKVLFSEEFNELHDRYDLDLKFVKSDKVDKDGHRYYTLDTSESDKIRPELGNRSYWEYYHFKVDEALSEKPPVYESYTVNPSLGFRGFNHVGMVVDEDCITPEIIAKHMNKFYELGQKDWESDTPVNPDTILYKYFWRNEKGVSLGNAIKELTGRS